MQLFQLNPDNTVAVIYQNVVNFNKVSDTKITWQSNGLNYILEENPLQYVTADDTVVATVGQPAPSATLLQNAKDNKIASLTASYGAEITSNITIASTGNIYSFQPDDQVNFLMEMAFMTRYPSEETTIYWDTVNNGKNVAHTVAQMDEIFHALRTKLRNALNKLHSLTDQVNSATTVDAVNAITW